MNIRTALLAAAACASIPATASAVAIADLRVTHITQGFYTTDPAAPTITSSVDTDIRLSSVSGAPPDMQVGIFTGGVPTYTLVPEQTRFIDYSYSMSVSDEGLPATGARSSFCAPLDGCFGASSVDGREVAYAALLVGYRDTRGFSPPGLVVFGPQIMLRTPSDEHPDFLTQSGVARASFLATGPNPPTSVTAGFFAFTFANGGVSSIPEPQTWAMLLTGLAVVGLIGRAKARPAKTATRAALR